MSTIKQKLAVFAIGLAITLAIGTAIGMLDNSHMAQANNGKHNGNFNGNGKGIIKHNHQNQLGTSDDRGGGGGGGNSI